MAKLSTLIALISYAIVLCGILPLFPWLGTGPRIMFVAAFAASVWQDRRTAWPLKEWLLNVSIVLVFLYYASQFSRASLVETVVSLLSIMLAVRLLGEKNSRHYLQIYTLSLFCLASSSLYDLSPVFLVYLAALSFMVAASLVLLAFHDQDKRMVLAGSELRKVLAAGLLMPLFSMPLLVFLFYLLPRTPLPLWDFLNAPGTATTAFADKVEPGAASATSESTALAFRAEMPRQNGQVYWRGKVFNTMNGNRWGRDEAVPPERIVYGQRRVSQTIYPEPGQSRFLVAADAPAQLKAFRSRRNQDGTFELLYQSRKRLMYEAESVTGGVLPVDKGIRRDFYLKLPEGLSPAVRRLANDIRSGADSDMGRIERLETYFRNNGYRYSTSGLPTGAQALDSFLLETKQGHCEFFASAHALILRAAGVPARLVGGYLGGDYNDLGGYYLITEKMAHVWVEAYVEGEGWLRIDPSSFAENAGQVWSRPASPGLLLRLRMLLDSIDHSWNRSVITYDFAEQSQLARKAGSRLQGLRPGQLLKGNRDLILPAAFAAGAALLWANRKRLFRTREERLLDSFYQAVRRDCRIDIRPGSMGLYEIAAQSGSRGVREFADIYAGAVYHDRRLTPAEYSRLKSILAKGFN